MPGLMPAARQQSVGKLKVYIPPEVFSGFCKGSPFFPPTACPADATLVIVNNDNKHLMLQDLLIIRCVVGIVADIVQEWY